MENATEPKIEIENILPIMINEYNNTFEQKAKIENKAIGYFAVLALIFSISATLAVFIIPSIKLDEIGAAIIVEIMSLIGVVNFGFFALVLLIICLLPRKIEYLPNDSMLIELAKGKDVFHGSLFKTIREITRKNLSIVKLISEYNEIAFIMIIIMTASFIIFLISFIFSL